jgi:two-component system, response regulator, stage 0 sporulation protein F
MGALTNGGHHHAGIGPANDGRRLTILLAEDDEDMRSVLASVLRRDGHRVLEISDGRDLMSAMVSGWFADAQLEDDVLLVTDLRMPGADSLSVIKAARGQGRQPQFILMTAFGDLHVHAEAQRLGALAVFDKPFDFDDLRGTVRDLAEQRTH